MVGQVDDYFHTRRHAGTLIVPQFQSLESESTYATARVA
jgi:hypothetical protein